MVGNGTTAGAVSEDKWDKYYDLVVEAVPRLRHLIDRGHWVKFNALRDRKMPFLEIVKRTELTAPEAKMYQSVRECIRKHDFDSRKVHDCIYGLIDP